MKRRVRKKIHDRFEKWYALNPGHFRSSKKRLRPMLRDLHSQLDAAMEWFFSKYCR